MDNIGKRIKEKRRVKGLSQKALADKVGVDNSQFSKIEAGKLYPTLSQLVEICTILEESIDWIVLGKRAGDSNQNYLIDLQKKHIENLEAEIKRLKSDIDVMKSKKYQSKDIGRTITSES